MPERAIRLLLLCALALGPTVPAAAVVLTGQVRSLGAQPIYAPPSIGSNVVMLSYYVDDGVQVTKGDPVLRIDAGAAAAQLQNLRDQIEQTQAKNAMDEAKAQLQVIDARIALINAEAAERAAAVDAAIPATLVPAIDYDRYQGMWTSAKRATKLAASKLEDARAALQRTRTSGAIALHKLELKLAFNQAQVDAATVFAQRDGTVVHAFMQMSFGGQAKGRYEQGSNTFSGAKVGKIVAAGSRYAVRAWVLESDRNQLHVGQQVRLSFDALPGATASGTISAISGSAAPKPEWGDGRYYQVDVESDAGLDTLRLLPGMSVRVQTDPPPTAAPAAAAHPADGVLKASGEIYARDSVAVSPPHIPRVWRLNITKMADDGSKVSKGEPIVVFAAGDMAQDLPASKSKLQEKQRALDKLRLDLADAARTVKLAVAKARADADKAERKAQQPEAYVPGIEYKKLVIDRERAAKVLVLTEKRAAVAARSRTAQLQQAKVEASIIEHEVQRLMQALAKLTITAPRDGVLLHRSSWDGEKYDVGSRVFRGTTIADIPDLDTLAVHATLPEHDFTRVHVGQKVAVTLAGGIARQIPGHVQSIGRSIHSRSRAEPEPVINLDISLDAEQLDGLKPGQQVQVTLQPTTKRDAA